LEPARYGDDRFFIGLRFQDDENSEIDTTIHRLRSLEQPVIVFELKDKYDLGAEFYRWEFATSIAGAILGIHPFNQPNVQQAKDATERLLQGYVKSGSLTTIETDGSVARLLAKAEKGKYLAIMAYLHETSRLDSGLTELRRKVAEGYGIATTLGYGPRFLHSTGQLHKGGPATGLFLQITSDHEADIEIPGRPYTFGVMAEAQALGDLQALQSLGRDITRVPLSKGGAEDLLELIDELRQ
jgi:glucose-6-phosphate isomerase/transaldolase/glucose-6-phosphate isomerase